MKKIFVRSPYFITINETGQTGSKVEVFLWNKGTTEPTTATYTLSKNIPSASITETNYNIANYAKEYIKHTNVDFTSSILVEEDSKAWCYCKVKRYKIVGTTETLLDTETFAFFNGYTLYNGGYNQNNTNSALALFNPAIKFYKTSETKKFMNVFVEAGNTIEFNNSDGYRTRTPTSDTLYRLSFVNGSNQFYVNSSEIFNYKVEDLCEPKYTPIDCRFINRYGGWDSIIFIKANSQSIETTNKEFQLLPSSVNYLPTQGQKKQFNQQGKRKVKCNTGWVNENYFELIQDLLLSETVYLDFKPAIVKSQSTEYKTHLKDKNINYEIEFEFNYGLINDVI